MCHSLWAAHAVLWFPNKRGQGCVSDVLVHANFDHVDKDSRRCFYYIKCFRLCTSNMNMAYEQIGGKRAAVCKVRGPGALRYVSLSTYGLYLRWYASMY